MKFSLPGFQCTSYREKDDCHLFYGNLSDASCFCPTCQTKSFIVHSFYTKTIQDLPISGKSVFVVVNARRFKCKNSDCPTNFFTQTTEFISTGSKKTTRLEDLIIDVATPTSFFQATNILRNMRIQTSKSTVARLFKKVLLYIDLSVSVACLDDFVLRKRQSYVSILIDAQSRTVIDLIPSRKLSDVQEWIQNFPNLTFIIRYGLYTFRSAISEVSPGIIQIADRFHVLKSLTDHAIKALRSLIPNKIEVDEEKKKSSSK